MGPASSGKARLQTISAASKKYLNGMILSDVISRFYAMTQVENLFIRLRRRRKIFLRQDFNRFIAG